MNRYEAHPLRCRGDVGDGVGLLTISADHAANRHRCSTAAAKSSRTSASPSRTAESRASRTLSGPATYDLRGLTVMPGWIDTHVHIMNHFGRDDRASTPGETPVEAMLYAAENAFATLQAGFTTVQSIGARRRQGPARRHRTRPLAGPAHPDGARLDYAGHARRDSRRGPQVQGRRRRPDQDLRLAQQPRRRRTDAGRCAAAGGMR